MTRKVRLPCVVVVAAAVVVFVVAGPTNDLSQDDDNGWTAFKVNFNKIYKNETEENFRRSVFYENQIKIEKHNDDYKLGLFSYKLKMNQFGDMLYEEFMDYMHAPNDTIASPRRSSKGEMFSIPNYNFELPDFIDWRKLGAVTPVQDQGLSCGSCWAFSAIGALEGQYFKKTGVLTPLSAQNLIDCTIDYGNSGCDGGSTAVSFQFALDNKGVEPEENYTYEAKAKKCPYNTSDDVDNDLNTSYIYVKYGDENEVKIAVALIGPLSTGIEGAHDTFRFYSEGIYYQQKCGEELDHAVLIVGYGRDDNNQDYWLVKNSWGTTWGEDGYFRIARNRNNNCGIAVTALYPVV